MQNTGYLAAEGGFSKSIEVPFSGIEAATVLSSMILPSSGAGDWLQLRRVAS